MNSYRPRRVIDESIKYYYSPKNCLVTGCRPGSQVMWLSILPLTVMELMHLCHSRLAGILLSRACISGNRNVYATFHRTETQRIYMSSVLTSCEEACRWFLSTFFCVAFFYLLKYSFKKQELQCQSRFNARMHRFDSRKLVGSTFDQ